MAEGRFLWVGSDECVWSSCRGAALLRAIRRRRQNLVLTAATGCTGHLALTLAVHPKGVGADRCGALAGCTIVLDLVPKAKGSGVEAGPSRRAIARFARRLSLGRPASLSPLLVMHHSASAAAQLLWRWHGPDASLLLVERNGRVRLVHFEPRSARWVPLSELMLLEDAPSPAPAAVAMAVGAGDNVLWAEVASDGCASIRARMLRVDAPPASPSSLSSLSRNASSANTRATVGCAVTLVELASVSVDSAHGGAETVGVPSAVLPNLSVASQLLPSRSGLWIIASSSTPPTLSASAATSMTRSGSRSTHVYYYCFATGRVLSVDVAAATLLQTRSRAPSGGRSRSRRDRTDARARASAESANESAAADVSPRTVEQLPQHQPQASDTCESPRSIAGSSDGPAREPDPEHPAKRPGETTVPCRVPVDGYREVEVFFATHPVSLELVVLSASPPSSSSFGVTSTSASASTSETVRLPAPHAPHAGANAKAPPRDGRRWVLSLCSPPGAAGGAVHCTVLGTLLLGAVDGKNDGRAGDPPISAVGLPWTGSSGGRVEDFTVHARTALVLRSSSSYDISCNVYDLGTCMLLQRIPAPWALTSPSKSSPADRRYIPREAQDPQSTQTDPTLGAAPLCSFWRVSGLTAGTIGVRGSGGELWLLRMPRSRSQPAACSVEQCDELIMAANGTACTNSPERGSKHRAQRQQLFAISCVETDTLDHHALPMRQSHSAMPTTDYDSKGRQRSSALPNRVTETGGGHRQDKPAHACSGDLFTEAEFEVAEAVLARCPPRLRELFPLGGMGGMGSMSQPSAHSHTGELQHSMAPLVATPPSSSVVGPSVKMISPAPVSSAPLPSNTTLASCEPSNDPARMVGMQQLPVALKPGPPWTQFLHGQNTDGSGTVVGIAGEVLHEFRERGQVRDATGGMRSLPSSAAAVQAHALAQARLLATSQLSYPRAPCEPVDTAASTGFHVDESHGATVHSFHAPLSVPNLAHGTMHGGRRLHDQHTDLEDGHVDRGHNHAAPWSADSILASLNVPCPRTLCGLRPDVLEDWAPLIFLVRNDPIDPNYGYYELICRLLFSTAPGLVAPFVSHVEELKQRVQPLYAAQTRAHSDTSCQIQRRAMSSDESDELKPKVTAPDARNLSDLLQTATPIDAANGAATVATTLKAQIGEVGAPASDDMCGAHAVAAPAALEEVGDDDAPHKANAPTATKLPMPGCGDISLEDQRGGLRRTKTYTPRAQPAPDAMSASSPSHEAIRTAATRVCAEANTATRELLVRYLRNVAEKPHEARFRRLRCSNASFSRVWANRACRALLETLGAYTLCSGEGRGNTAVHVSLGRACSASCSEAVATLCGTPASGATQSALSASSSPQIAPCGIDPSEEPKAEGPGHTADSYEGCGEDAGPGKVASRTGVGANATLSARQKLQPAAEQASQRLARKSTRDADFGGENDETGHLDTDGAYRCDDSHSGSCARKRRQHRQPVLSLERVHAPECIFTRRALACFPPSHSSDLSDAQREAILSLLDFAGEHEQRATALLRLAQWPRALAILQALHRAKRPSSARAPPGRSPRHHTQKHGRTCLAGTRQAKREQASKIFRCAGTLGGATNRPPCGPSRSPHCRTTRGSLAQNDDDGLPEGEPASQTAWASTPPSGRQHRAVFALLMLHCLAKDDEANACEVMRYRPASLRAHEIIELARAVTPHTSMWSNVPRSPNAHASGAEGRPTGPRLATLKAVILGFVA